MERIIRSGCSGGRSGGGEGDFDQIASRRNGLYRGPLRRARFTGWSEAARCSKRSVGGRRVVCQRMSCPVLIGQPRQASGGRNVLTVRR
jgi:hypothetical protein